MPNPQQTIPDLPLRDIHLPEPGTWWPLAPGWWLLLGVVILIGLMLWALRLWLRHVSRRKRALAKFKALQERHLRGESAHSLVSELSVLIRRTAISLYPREEAAGLTGEDWLHWLDKAADLDPEKGFCTPAGRSLINAPYRPETDVDMDGLLAISADWFSHIRPKKTRRKAG